LSLQGDFGEVDDLLRIHDRVVLGASYFLWVFTQQLAPHFFLRG